jgi:two-component system sensor histidine kinase BaeS
MKWHHSLYWRIAVGFVACLALLLIVQGVLFVWVVARTGRSIPNQPPERLAQTIAVEIAQAIEDDPALDVAAYVEHTYSKDAQPFFVLLVDGRRAEIGGPFPEDAIAEARERLDLFRRGGPGRGMRGFGRGRGFIPPPAGEPRPGGPGPGEPRPRSGVPGDPNRGFEPGFGRGAPPEFRLGRPAPIVTPAGIAGVVVVPPRPPFTFLLRNYAPTLALVALATLVVGAALATVVIFGPARRRLSAVEDAARRLGAGDLAARAPDSGRDEVAAVAAAFNSMADELAARADALAASDRARRQLLADVSHEHTTPITAIRGYLETLRMPDFSTDEATRARYLGIITDETARLEHIVGDLLDLARLEGGGGTLTIDDVPVAELFERVRARHERALEDAHVTLETRIEPDAGHVTGDRDRLEQALQNLAANALRYAPSGSTITLVAKPVQHGVSIAITDRGAGIDPAHLPHVFDRFYKADSSRTVRSGGSVAGGSGLGLSIVKAIVERHGGSVTARSAPGETTFELTFPI